MGVKIAALNLEINYLAGRLDTLVHDFLPVADNPIGVCGAQCRAGFQFLSPGAFLYDSIGHNPFFYF